MKPIACIPVVISLLVLLSSCTEEGSLEEAGERADEIVDNVKEGDPILKKKGALEKTGEAIEETLDGKD